MGDNAIHYLGHVKMMSAVQPFLSGAISKTINMPEDVTVEDVEQLHIDAWKMGLKSVAIYRDNCKVAQPLSMAKKENDKQTAAAAVTTAAAETVPSTSTAAVASAVAEAMDNRIVVKGAIRRELPKERIARTFSFTVADSHGYLIVGEYEDGTPGEVFVNFSKHGSTLRGIMDAFAISMSHGLQYGVPLKSYIKSFLNTSFAPAGITDDPSIRTASSLVDFIARRLALTYLSFDDRLELGLASIDDMPESQTTLLEEPELQEGGDVDDGTGSNLQVAESEAVGKPPAAAAKIEQPHPALTKKAGFDDAAPICYNCGNQTQRAGSCFVCTSCGSTTGCS
jgi:ribonucleoside-diphosphate reductase alpha chain